MSDEDFYKAKMLKLIFLKIKRKGIIQDLEEIEREIDTQRTLIRLHEEEEKITKEQRYKIFLDALFGNL